MVIRYEILKIVSHVCHYTISNMEATGYGIDGWC